MVFLTSYGLCLTVFGIGLTAVVLKWLRSRAILDAPNERSNHTVPTPRGGGIAVSLVILIGWGGVIFAKPDLATGLSPWLILPVIGLCLLSWVDDLKGLGAGVRLPAHLLACGIGVWALPGQAAVFQGVFPTWLDATLTVFLWAGFLNFYNFMDGIDGITGVETLSISSGLILVAALLPAVSLPVAGPLVVGAAALGFLCWNWAPAKLFMGDIGSIPLGFSLGWFLLFLAVKGYWVPALILPGYYLADAGITLLRRIARREKFWQAHRQHFYQQAVAGRIKAGMSRTAAHRRISAAIAGLNVCLVGMAAWSVSDPWAALGCSILLVCGFLAWLKR